jgi:rfaE bifunctional protein kinase chain/domain
MVSIDRLLDILDRMPELRILLAGDLFLDRYLEIDRSLTEVSLETGLEAHQVTEVRSSPGAGGNVIANLRALSVQVSVVSIIGDDGEGYMLRRHLADLGVDTTGLVVAPDRVTPTYTKPMMHEPDGTVHELSRLDICNRTPTPARVEQAAVKMMQELASSADGILVADQVSAPEVGVVTTRLREALTESARTHPRKPHMVDSRMRVGLFERFMLKPNAAEALRALDREATDVIPLEQAGAAGSVLARRVGRTVFVTVGDRGILVCDERRSEHVPAVPVKGEIDVVGAGDTTISAMLASLCAGATETEAAEIGNLASSVTIQKIGTTGTASPQEVVEARQSMPS